MGRQRSDKELEGKLQISINHGQIGTKESNLNMRQLNDAIRALEDEEPAIGDSMRVLRRRYPKEGGIRDAAWGDDATDLLAMQ